MHACVSVGFSACDCLWVCLLVSRWVLVSAGEFSSVPTCVYVGVSAGVSSGVCGCIFWFVCWWVYMGEAGIFLIIGLDIL